MMRFIKPSWLLLITIIAGCNTGKYKTITKTDSNGYNYQEVTNDPYKAREYTLNNGLKVILTRNTDQARVAALIGVRAGSVQEDPNATGLAHYLEHMMFKGTSKIGTVNWEAEKVLLDEISDLFEAHRSTSNPDEKKAIYAKIDSLSQIAATYVATNEFDKLYTAMGASNVNAGTSYESTVYMCEIPKNELERWAKIESERFGGLVLRLFHTELEVVYEEFNMYQDMDDERAWMALTSALFPNHPYGRDVIGYPEHLKNPSMKEIYEFLGKYYVPSNMAIVLAGDLEYEPAIQLIDKYFGQFESGTKAAVQQPKEEPLKSIIEKEVVGPETENMIMAYRFNGIGTEDDLMVSLISSILSNRQAGLMDLNLVQNQKVLQAGSSAFFLKDYGVHILNGTPRQGQTLEEVRDLLLAEIENLKTGNFDEWLVEAIVNRQRIDFMRRLEMPFSSAYSLMNMFIYDQPLTEVLARLDKMEKITKQQIQEFAQKNYGENYVIVYKRTGENKDLVKVEKPAITSVPVNRDLQSEFATEILAMQQPDIEPVFVDFNESMHKTDIREGLPLFHVTNETNELFNLALVFEMGKKHDLLLPLAVEYLPLIGTSQYSPEELRKVFFRYGLAFSVNVGNDRCNVSISGLNSQLEKALELLQHVLNQASANQDTYAELIKTIEKKRADAKKSQNDIFNAMIDYGIYGNFSPGKYILSMEQMQSVNPDSLTEIIKNLTAFKHKIHYYGPSDNEKVAALVKQHYLTPENLKDTPQPVKFEMVSNEQAQVYLIDYDINQANMFLVAKAQPFNKQIMPFASVFNNYFGRGLSSVVFQEIRESRALAYSAYAIYNPSPFSNDNDILYAYLGTQADKLDIATSAMLSLMNKMPRAEAQYNMSIEGIIKKTNTERITKRNLFWTYLTNSNRGIEYDIRKDIYDTVKTMDINTFEEFFNSNISNKKYTYLVMGKRDSIDKKVLLQLGKVSELSLEDIFGY